jgi:hypothetical protein
MHRSKLAGFIIDCQTTDLGGAADFWSQALGMEKKALPAEEGEKYVGLRDPQDRLHIEVQRVSHPSRVYRNRRYRRRGATPDSARREGD